MWTYIHGFPPATAIHHLVQTIYSFWDKKNAARKSINTGLQPCPSRYNILHAPKFNYSCSGLLSSPILYGTNNIYLREGSPSAHPSLMKNYILMSSSMSYETLRGPELSPLAPYYMGHCHPPFFHVIWYQVAIVCEAVEFFIFVPRQETILFSQAD